MKIVFLVLSSILTISLRSLVGGVALTETTPDYECGNITRWCQYSNNVTCNTDHLKIDDRCRIIIISLVALLELILALTIVLLLSYIYRWIKGKRQRSQKYCQLSQGRGSHNVVNSQSITPPVNMDANKEDEGKPMHSFVEDSDGADIMRPSESYIKRSEVRTMEMAKEKDASGELQEEMFKHKSKPRTFKKLPDLGSRLQKYWNNLETKEDGKVLQVTIKASRQCTLTLEDPNTIQVLRSLFKHIQHPYLLVIHDITYRDDYVGILQEYVKSGSVRDYLFKVSPDKDWEAKYNIRGGVRSFKKEEIAKCGYQVLKAVEVLYDLGFTHISHIHSGNVFMVSGMYVLGGYENSLLGYRTSLYQSINEEGLLHNIDIIMFGHLMYEICTSKLTETLRPADSDYEKIQDPELQEVIKFIFDSARGSENHKELWEQISSHSFFQYFTPTKKTSKINPLQLPEDVGKLMSVVFSAGLKLESVIQSLGGKYASEVHLPKLGWRHGKLWAKARHTELKMEGLLTALVVPQNCPIFVRTNISTIRKLLQLKHDFLVTIRDVDYREIDGQHVLVIFQDMMENGSLKDIIYQSTSTSPWASKYTAKEAKLKAEQVALYGAQLLQAMLYLSNLDKQDSPLILGCVHTGNIFIDGSSCRLGGFENTLLGYQPRRLTMFQKKSTNLDAYMFGHMIFEMSTGRELLTAVPSEKDYREVPGSLRQVLQNIFENESVKLDEIKEWLPITSTLQIIPGEEDLTDDEDEAVDSNVKFLLEKVRKGKARDQDDHVGKGKHLFQSGFRKLKDKVSTLQ